MPPILGDMGRWCCCYCNDTGIGRIIFLNDRREVVDNPFCEKHKEIVCKHTLRRLKKHYDVQFHATAPYFVIESWPLGYQNRRSLPPKDHFFNECAANRRQRENVIKNNVFTY